MKTLACFFFLLIIASPLLATQGFIIESQGISCMTKKSMPIEIEIKALDDAKTNAINVVMDSLKNYKSDNNSTIEALFDAYYKPKIEIITRTGRWDKEPPSPGDCYKVSAKLLITPNDNISHIVTKENIDTLNLPLMIKTMFNKKSYRSGDNVKIYFIGNKPYLARVFYKDPKGSIYQLIPNKDRDESAFEKSTIYELPSNKDKFEIKAEKTTLEDPEIIVVASTTEFGKLRLSGNDQLVKVSIPKEDLIKTLADIKLKEKVSNLYNVEEFFYEVLKIPVE
jgi:hypothetical protein